MKNTDFPLIHGCCVLGQINCGVGSTAESIIHSMKTVYSDYGVTTFLIILKIPAEETLLPILKELKFVELMEFSRRKQYDQNERLKLFVLEPGFNPLYTPTKEIKENKVIVSKNKKI